MKKVRTSILEAVQAAITLDTQINSYITGGIWTGEIPEGQTMPYASLEVDSTDFEFTGAGIDLERTRFSVVMFSTGAAEIDNLADRLQEFITNAEYQFTNDDDLVCMFPSRRTTRSEFARDKDGNQIFTSALMFEAAVFRH